MQGLIADDRAEQIQIFHGRERVDVLQHLTGVLTACSTEGSASLSDFVDPALRIGVRVRGWNSEEEVVHVFRVGVAGHRRRATNPAGVPADDVEPLLQVGAHGEVDRVEDEVEAGCTRAARVQKERRDLVASRGLAHHGELDVGSGLGVVPVHRSGDLSALESTAAVFPLDTLVVVTREPARRGGSPIGRGRCCRRVAGEPAGPARRQREQHNGCGGNDAGGARETAQF